MYADLPGFGLSERGHRQAATAAAHLAGTAVSIVISSPIRRAVETALPVARALGLPVVTDHRLYEWRLSNRWAGVTWEDLPEVFPGELEAYLAAPTELTFAPESLAAVAGRFAAAVADAGRRRPGGTAVFVSHQDPVQAIRLHLTGRPPEEQIEGKPGHAAVVSLARGGSRWEEAWVWEPDPDDTGFPPSG